LTIPPSQFEKIVEFLMVNHVGLIQMPCPELQCIGLDRGDERGSERPLLEENTRIRELLSEPEQLYALRQTAEFLVRQIREYQDFGFQVLGVIGVDRSPSCGVTTTSINGAEEPGRGVFMEALAETLAESGINTPMVGTKTQEPEVSLEKIKRLVREDL
jgi:predicted secreted protein